MIYTIANQKYRRLQQVADITLNNDARLKRCSKRGNKDYGRTINEKNNSGNTFFKSLYSPLKQSFPSRVNESTNVPK
jgi:hypothetical protein